MKRLWTIIGVRQVSRSFGWYQTLLGLAPGAPAHPDFGQLLDADGTVLLCVTSLHALPRLPPRACLCDAHTT